MDRRAHWDRIYRTKRLDELSWTQPSCGRSLAYVLRTGLPADAPLIDVGGGASVLIDQLLDLGYTDLTVLDVSGTALELARLRLGERAKRVTWLEGDITSMSLPGRYAIWHDRAVFHFLTAPEERRAYAARLATALKPGGYAIFSAFAKDGPERCSGLEVRRYDCEELRRELQGPFSLVDRAKDDHVTPSGAIQKFSACLFKCA